MAIFSHSGGIGEGPSSSTSRNACGERLTNCAFASGDVPLKRIITGNIKDQERFNGMSPDREGNSVRAETKRSRSDESDESAGDGDPISSRSEEHMDVRTPIRKKGRMSARSYRALLNPDRRRAGNLGSEHEGIEADCLQGEDLEIPKSIKSTSNSSTSSLHRENLSVFKMVRTTKEGLPDTEDEPWSGGRFLSLSHLNNSSEAIPRNDSHTVCVVCNQTGSLLCCGRKSCNSAYHLACLDPPLNETPLRQWLCFCCLRKKMEFGVYSVSEGVESIWDSREEMQEMHYLAKYKGLAHAHNRWIPESWLLPEDSMLLAKFKKHRKKQVKKWKQDWMQPHRLLKKRFLIPPERTNECSCGHGDNYEYCYLEWFVKWKGLGYEHATWEFENSPFLCSAEGKTLIDDYERRREQAKKGSDPSRTGKVEYIKKNPFDNLSRLLDGCLSELDNTHLEYVRRILKRWYGNQNAVIIDDQERIIKSIMFILSLMPYTCRPFLVISKTSCLSTWEAEFVRLAPSISTVVYSGDRNVRKMIQSLEFYEEGGCIMFHVLLASPNDVVEDLEAFDCIGWEAVIIDDCQKSGVSKHLGQLSNLTSAFRLLLMDSLPKDNIVDYLNILSFLDPSGQERPVSLKLEAIDSNDEFSILKQRLRQYLVGEHTQNSSVFVEYWVPVQLSEVQLMQYCDILLSHSHLLCSRVKPDCVTSLLDVLVSIRKCCDHPYLVDDSMERSVAKSRPVLECLDFGVNASGKLQFLDKILHETKNCGIKVLILFQSYVSAGRNSMGDILCDFLHQRFGEDSFAYVDGRIDVSDRGIQDSVQSFNDTGSEQFIIVIEKRACHSTIKLSSVDAVIVYDSDLNLSNDLKAFRKLTIESPVHLVKFFRLYSPYTVEEKVLILAKEDEGIDAAMERTSTRLRNSLLSWGAMYLFSKLEFCKFDISKACPKPFSDNVLVNDMIGLLTQSPKDIDIAGARSCSNIAKISLSGASYSSNISLFGEKDELSSSYGDPTHFWSNLLQKRSHEFKSTSEQSSRIRYSARCLNEYTNSPQTDSYKLEKGRKLGNVVTESQCGREAGELGETAVPEHITFSSVNQPTLIRPTAVANDTNNEKTVVHSFMREPVETENLCDAQKKLHDSLKPELVQPCETLNFPARSAVLEQGGSQSYVPSSYVAEYLIANVSSQKSEIRDDSDIQGCSEKPPLEKIQSLSDKMLKERFKLIDLVCSARLDDLLAKQSQEVTEFKTQIDDQKQLLLRTHGLGLEKIRAANIDFEVCNDMKKLHEEFAEEMNRFNQYIKCQRKKLSVMQILARINEKKIKDQWLEQAKLGCLVESFDMLPMSVTGFKLENFNFHEQIEAFDKSLNFGSSFEATKSAGSIELHISDAGGVTIPKMMSPEKELSIFNLKTVMVGKSSGQNRITSKVSAANSSQSSSDELFETRSPSSGCNISSGKAAGSTESADNNMTVISSTSLSGVAFDRLIQTAATVSQCNYNSGLAIGSTGASSGVPEFIPMEEMDDILAEEDSSACQSKSAYALEPTEPSITSLEIAEPVQCERIADDPMEMEAIVPQHEIMNVSGDDDSIPGTSAQHTERAKSDGACLTSFLPSQTSVASFSQTSDCARCENTAPPPKFQVSFVIETENHVVSGTETEPDCSHPHDIVIPMFNGDTELTPSEHCNQITVSSDPILQQLPLTDLTSDVPSNERAEVEAESGGQISESSDPILQQLPPTDLTSDVPSNERSEVQAESGGQPSNRSHFACQLDGVSRSAPTVATSTKIRPANNSFSDSVVLPVTGISDVATRNIQNHHLMSSSVQTETINSPQVLSEVQQHMHEEGPDSDPLLHEMIGLRTEEYSLTQDCEKKKLELQVECDKELENVRKNYASLMQEMETEYTQKMNVNKKRQRLIQMNHNLAKNFRGSFIDNKLRTSAISQGEPSSLAQQLFQSPRPDIAETLSRASPPTPGPSPLHYPRVLHNPSSSATPPPARPIYSNLALLSNNSVRHHPTFQSNVNPFAGTEPRAPAPHLRPFR